MRKLCVLTLAITGITAILNAQSKQPLKPEDYTRWETISMFPGSVGISPDGRWLAYEVTRSSRDVELRVKTIGSAPSTEKTILYAMNPVFSADGKWLAYSIGLSDAESQKMQKEKKPVHRKLGLKNLGTGAESTIDNVESFAFSRDGLYLAMRHYTPEKKDPAPTADEETTPGATLIVRNLSTGRDATFGSVSEYAWQDLPKTGHLLAFAISTDDKSGNGLDLLDPATDRLRVLDSSAAIYTGIAWRRKGADVAVLRSHMDDKHDGANYSALAWRDVGGASEKAFTFDPGQDSKFPSGMRTVSYRKPMWSDDGETVFLGYAKWSSKPPKKADGDKKDDDEQPGVDVWHWRDPEVMPRQKTGAKTIAQRNMMAAWNLSNGSFVPLASSLQQDVTPVKHQQLALLADSSPYALERSIGRPEANLSLVDTATGAQTTLKQGLANDHYAQVSPAGKYVLYLEGNQYWTIDTHSHKAVNISQGAPASFIDRESDWTVKQKPPFGVAGWTKDDGAVILYDKFDLWRVSPDGAHATKLTDGSKDQIRHRYVKLDPDDEFIDFSKPVYLSLFGIWTKQSGYARLQTDGNGEPKEEHLLLQDKSISGLQKAKDADEYIYVSQTFAESPNLYSASDSLKEAHRESDTNPTQSQYAWGREQLIDYKNSKGDHLQGALYYPATYETGKQYPMIVYMYEKLSDNLHHYVAPSQRDYYNIGAFSQHGYFVLTPDILFRPREPGLSVADCVGAAVKRVVELGAVDPKKVGIIGHSWGGFDSTFLATHTTMFSAAVAGAPITDLVSNYGNHHWSSGIAETDHIETGQQRMEVPIYEDLQAYIRNSAVFNVQNMTTPLLIEVGDADGTVFYHQGIELYNIARRAKKNVVLLVYAGEDHPVRKKADQIDYQRRIFAWFDHYLKGDAAPTWITEGQSYQQHQEELKLLKK